MPLPLALIRAAQDQPVMVELKSGDTLSGTLAACDSFMNLNLKELVCTSQDGERFWKMPDCYVRGNNVKYFRLPDDVYEQATKASLVAASQDSRQNAGPAGLSGDRIKGRQNPDWQPSGRGRGRGIDLADRNSKTRKLASGRRGA